MKIAVLKEQAPGESRVAVTPDSVKKFVSLGWEVAVEKNAGLESGIVDAEYTSAGANLTSASEALSGAHILLTVNKPSDTTLGALTPGTVLIGMLSPFDNKEGFAQYAAKNISSFSMELVPRISRAQSMDVLSSQSNLAGYKAVIDAAATFGKVMPMMMTAAGTVAPAKVLVLGAGVAGLQAIATAKRLGGVVSAFDVRPVVKEQVESLGAKFIEVPSEEGGETAGGYAKEMSEEYKKKQSLLIHETLKKQDIVISTALIPGRPAPRLITEEMIADMKQGSVIVDLAAASGGNAAHTKPDEIIQIGGVTIIGHTNLPSRVAVDASQLYARNLYNFVAAVIAEKDQLAVKWDDEIVKGTLVTKDGAIVHPMFAKG